MSHKCEKLFESVSKSTAFTATPVILSVLAAIAIIILSIIQAFPIIENPSTGFDESGWEDLCSDGFIQYLTPFHVNAGGSRYGCQWRPRNTIFRTIIISLSLINAIISLVVIFAHKFEKLWPVFYWTFWIAFVMMFVVFILDCDAINTGLNQCYGNFEVEGYTFITFYDTQGNTISDYDCKIDPYVWIAIADLVASLMFFCTYKVSRYYILDPTERRLSTTSATKSTPSKQTSSPQQTNVVDGTNNTNNTNNTEKEDSPDPFQQYQGGYEVNNNQGNTDQNHNTNMGAYDE